MYVSSVRRSLIRRCEYDRCEKRVEAGKVLALAIQGPTGIGGAPLALNLKIDQTPRDAIYIKSPYVPTYLPSKQNQSLSHD